MRQNGYKGFPSSLSVQSASYCSCWMDPSWEALSIGNGPAWTPALKLCYTKSYVQCLTSALNWSHNIAMVTAQSLRGSIWKLNLFINNKRCQGLIKIFTALMSKHEPGQCQTLPDPSYNDLSKINRQWGCFLGPPVLRVDRACYYTGFWEHRKPLETLPQYT